MKTALNLILTALALAGLAACSDSSRDSRNAGRNAAVTDQADKPASQQVDLNVELCRTATQKLGGALKSALLEAMERGGPVAAMDVCHDEAVGIARRICEEEGLSVGRTSLKFRNPANAPDGWEKEGLAALALRLAAGEKFKDLEMWATVTEADGNRSFRYLKAIPTSPVCLHCHGSELAPGLVDRLDDLYPDDMAKGFNVGDMRGAFTVKIELPIS